MLIYPHLNMLICPPRPARPPVGRSAAGVAMLCAGLLAAGAHAAHVVEDSRLSRVENGLLPIATTKPGERRNIEDRMRDYGVTGLSVAVVDGGKIAWAKGYGMADAASGRNVTTHTIFQAASISKPVSAMGVLVLVQQGRLRLDEDVNEALRSWRVPDNDFTRRQPVTVRMLLNHTAGLAHTGANTYIPLSMGDPFPSMVEVLTGKPPATAGPVNVISLPGSAFAYSAAGYEVLQQLVLDLSGESFEQYMQTAVLRPIEMTDSSFSQDLSSAQLSHSATGYYAGGKPLPGRFRVGPDLSVAGLWTTPTDIARYIINLQRSNAGQAERPLSPRMTREMLTPGLGSRGLGPAVSGGGQTVRFGHDGFNEGFESSFIAYRHLGKGAVIMANSGFAFMLIKEVLGSISRVYDWPEYGATTQQPPSASIGQQLVVPIPPPVLKAAPGQYALDDIHITLFRRGQRLFVEWPTNGTAEVFATPDGRLFCPPLIFSDIGTPWLRLHDTGPGNVPGIVAGDDERIEFRRLN